MNFCIFFYKNREYEKKNTVQEEELKRMVEDEKFDDFEKMEKVFKSFVRRTERYTPEQIEKFKQDLEERTQIYQKELQDQEDRENEEYRSSLPPHLQFRELSFDDMQKKHRELLQDPEEVAKDKHLELTNRFFFGEKVHPKMGETIERGVDMEEFEETPANLEKMRKLQFDYKEKVDMIFERFVEDAMHHRTPVEEPFRKTPPTGDEDEDDDEDITDEDLDAEFGQQPE